MTDVLDPDYWRRLAAESRATAQALQDHVAKALALKMAGVYDDMAGRAAQLLRHAEEQEPLTPSVHSGVPRHSFHIDPEVTRTAVVRGGRVQMETAGRATAT